MLEGNRYRLYDAGSTSGTWVNEQQVPEYGIQLRDGDEIFLGQVHLRFRQL
jgi:pSer/pThr/pTyr-binding forkhead associated (FHA) protein